MKKATILIILLLFTSGSILSQTTTAKSSNKEINSTLWDDASVKHFSTYMKGEIKKILGENDFNNEQLNSWVEQIVDEANKKLKSMKKSRFKYISNVILLPKGSSYKKNTSYWWQPKLDKSINIKAETKFLHCLLVVYCVKA